MGNLSNKNRILLIIGVIVVFTLSMLFVTYKINADEFANKVTIDKSEITEIITGTTPFDNSEIEGNDISSADRKVRSFDKIFYNVEFTIKSKEDVIDLEDRIVDIIVNLSDEDIKYVSFASENENLVISDDKKTATYSVKDVNTYGNFTETIILNVNSAPNGYEIKPTFKIKESTDLEEAKELKLNSDIINYMPTIVSSKSNVDIVVVSSNETQTASVNKENGRYVTFGIGLQLNGDNSNKGIKGLQLPKGDISFDINLTQNNGQNLILDESNIRLYNDEKNGDINPVKMNLPYTTTGNVKVTKKSDAVYTVTISDYEYNDNVTNADGSIIDNNRSVFMTLAVSAFSKRTEADSKNNIVATLTANSSNANISKTQNDTDLKESVLNNNTASVINEYREVSDYLLSGTFVNGQTLKSISNQVDKERHYGSVTKGSIIGFESNFNFENNVLKTGISQMIKIDPNAYEVVRLNNDKAYSLVINCGVEKCDLYDTDFEVKYVTGDFLPENYEVINYSDETLDKSLLTEDIASIKNQCLNVKNNYSKLNSDQIMNLYGGPCLKAKEKVEEIYTSIGDISGKKITKIILETKKDKILDKKINVDFIVGLQIRNVPDITQTYQAATLVKSKDNNNTIYFAPTITNDNTSVANFNNYIKTTYLGTTPTVDNKTYADSLKIVNYTAKNTISVTNKKTDGTKKKSYISSDNETLNYQVDIKINDDSQNVGADDVWYIKELKITINLSKYLEFKQNSNYLVPSSIVKNQDGTTTIVYMLPYTKTNRVIDPVLFDAVFKSDIKGSSNAVVVTSTVDAVNVNNEVDTSAIGSTSSKEVIYVTGANGIIITEETGNLGNIIEKDKKFNYNLNVYNNSDNNINNLSLMDILPYNNDENGSSFNGSYKVKVTLPLELTNTKVYCYTGEIGKLSSEVDSTLNIWESCNITNDYVDAKAIKFEEISVNANTKLSPIVIELKPTGNNYGDKYNNKFYAKSDTLTQTTSSIAKVRVVNRSISGQVFIDTNENGIKDDNSYLKDIPISICKLDSYNNCKEVDSSKTNENGEYSFNKLDVGRYKINFIYNAELYDVTGRYFGSNEATDSDAYKVSDDIGKAEISGRENGIKITKDAEKVKNMDMGLISRKSFEVDIKKGINKIELNENGILNTYQYEFLKTVSLSVKNVKNLTGKVTYGFEVVNTSNQAGYVKMIEENIPYGMTFNPEYEQNKDWFSVNGNVYYDALKDTLLQPGDRKTFEIVLDVVSDEEAKVLLNEVSIVEVEAYEKEEVIRPDDEYVINNFEIGSSLEFAGVNWHVINDDGTNVTLLLDEGEITKKMGHLNGNSNVYKWSESQINKYLNNEWLKKETSLDATILLDQTICDDASGLQVASFGGTLVNEGTCQSGIYNSYKVRLLTRNEFDLLVSKLTDISFLVGNESYWLMNSNYEEHEVDEYGTIKNDVSNTAFRINKSTSATPIAAVNKLGVRAVITIPKANILVE